MVVLDHYRSGASLETPCNEIFSAEGKRCIVNHIREMVQNTPSSRPAASILFERFKRHHDEAQLNENVVVGTVQSQPGEQQQL